MTTTIRLTIPATINDVTVGQYLGWCALQRQVHTDQHAGVKWYPRQYARHVLSVFSGVDAELLGELDDTGFQDAFAQLTFLQQFDQMKVNGEYTGGTFAVGDEVFPLPSTLDDLNAGQWEIIEKTLDGSNMFERLHYVLAILSMMDVPNILAKEKELHRRAELIAQQMLFVDAYTIAFFLPSGKKGSGILTQFFFRTAAMNKVAS